VRAEGLECVVQMAEFRLPTLSAHRNCPETYSKRLEPSGIRTADSKLIRGSGRAAY